MTELKEVWHTALQEGNFTAEVELLVSGAVTRAMLMHEKCIITSIFQQLYKTRKQSEKHLLLVVILLFLLMEILKKRYNLIHWISAY